VKESDPKDLAKRLRAVIDTVIDGVITIDSRGAIESVNPAAATLFQYHTEELLGRNVSVLMPEPDQSRHDQYLTNYLTTKQPKIIGIGREVKGKKKDGSIFPMRLAVSEVILDSNECIFTGIIHDLSDVKNAEQALISLNLKLEATIEQRTEKLNEVINKLLDVNKKYEAEIEQRKIALEALRENEIQLTKMLDREKELNELKSRFLSMASHEFKTPLSTILSSASLIRKYSLEDHLEKREKHIDRIKRSVEHLDAILNDFLALGKLEERKVEIKKQLFYTSELINEVKDELTDQLKPMQRFEEMPGTEDIEIYTDKRILKNILFNLISNASKYSDDGQSILYRIHQNETQLQIDIQDTGMGIPEEEQKHLFTRFFRATNAVNIKGTGLGLGIVKEYLQLLDGEISFKSELGRGSIFSITLKK